MIKKVLGAKTSTNCLEEDFLPREIIDVSYRLGRVQYMKADLLLNNNRQLDDIRANQAIRTLEKACTALKERLRKLERMKEQKEVKPKGKNTHTIYAEIDRPEGSAEFKEFMDLCREYDKTAKENTRGMPIELFFHVECIRDKLLQDLLSVVACGIEEVKMARKKYDEETEEIKKI